MRVSKILALFGLALFLAGCGSGVLRNREYSYMDHPISQNPVLKTPAGLTQPQFQQTLSLPKGPNQYPAVPEHFSLAPPGLNKQYTKAQLATWKKQKTNASTHPQADAETK